MEDVEKKGSSTFTLGILSVGVVLGLGVAYGLGEIVDADPAPREVRGTMPAPNLTRADFDWWDPKTRGYEEQIVEAVNTLRMAQTECWKEETYGPALSENATADAPFFFITCSGGTYPVNVWFDLNGRHWTK